MPRDIIGETGGRPYSPGTRKDNHIFVSGQLGLDSKGQLVPGGAGAETRQALENVQAVLVQAGATLADVTMVNVYLTDLDRDYGAMNAVYIEYFGTESPPARATVEVSKLASGGIVEISAIALL